MLQGVTSPKPEYQALAANQAPAHLVPAQPVFQVDGSDPDIRDVSSLVDIFAEESSSATIIAAPEEVHLAEPASHTVSFQPGLEDKNSLLAYTYSNHKTDVGSLEHQGAVVVEEDRSCEPDVAGGRCAFCELLL